MYRIDDNQMRFVDTFNSSINSYCETMCTFNITTLILGNGYDELFDLTPNATYNKIFCSFNQPRSFVLTQHLRVLIFKNYFN